MSEAPPPTPGDVLAAASRLRGAVRRTPLEPAPSLAPHAGTEVLLKLENQQRTGSFKLRGALNRIAMLGERERSRGVVTASAGNHGLGVALAARLHGTRATVYLGAGAPTTKRNRIARYGAEIREVDGGYDDAHEAAVREAERGGALYVHAFSDPAVVAGQGTIGLELLQEVPAPAAVVLPVGGGGLIGGVGVLVRALSPRTRIVGVQTEETSAMHASLAAGRPTSPAMGETLCEGLSGDVDERSLGLARQVVDEIVLVSEAAVRRAIRRLYVEEGILAEGSGVVAAAALHEGLVRAEGGAVLAVITGGNIDADRAASILAEPA